MLKSLQIKNYALIQHLDVDFSSGFSTITGETGAGKSILLGALGLIVGNRADSSVLNNKDEKCSVEATFDIRDYLLQGFFEANDLDYENETIIRREIAPNGKSRAFINDTPSNLSTLKELGASLIDIHSQHENLQLNDNLFQMNVLDAVAQNKETKAAYQKSYKQYKELQTALAQLKEEAQQAASDLDYNTFQLNQLEELQLEQVVLEELEQEMELAEHAEAIQSGLGSIVYLLSEEEQNVNSRLLQAKQTLDSIRTAFPKAAEYAERIESCRIELNDIASESENEAEGIVLDPQKAALLKEKLDSLYQVIQKHGVSNIGELIEVRESFNQKVNQYQNGNEQIARLEQELQSCEQNLSKLGAELSKRRTKAVTPIQKHIQAQLAELGMQNTVLEIDIQSNSHYYPHGRDQINFLFSANKNMAAQNISKIASGGEISRFMLSLKDLLSTSVALPTIIFDEIDTGVSGDIADKMANIMQQMGQNMQVISITHLPQIAARGKNHYRVEKSEKNNLVQTYIYALKPEERVEEIARMLSGSNITPQAIANAKTLLA